MAEGEEGELQRRLSLGSEFKLAILEYAPMGLIAFRSDGKVVEYNKKMKEITGYGPEEIKNFNDWLKIIEPQGRFDRFIHSISPRAWVSGLVVQDKEVYIKHKNGQKRVVLYTTGEIIDRDGRLTMLVTMITDITEKKRLEDKLVDYQRKLERKVAERAEELRIKHQQLLQSEKMAALGYLISGIAHEISNPSNFISFNLPVLEKYWMAIAPALEEYCANHPGWRVAGLPCREFRQDFESLLLDLKEGVERLNRIASQLKNYAKSGIGAGKTPLDINSVVEESVAFCRKYLKNWVKDVEVCLAPDLPAVVGDAGKLSQVFMNLLINAAKAAGKDDGRIRVTSVHEDRERRLAVIVSDNGRGMDRQTMEKIFDPLFTTRAEQGGCGLGLSVSLGIVREHGGFIEVRSAPGRGSSFKVCLPEAGRQPLQDTTMIIQEDENWSAF